MSEVKKELTAKEKQEMIRYYNEGIKVGTATHDTGYDEDAVEKAIIDIYKIANLPKPLIIWQESPPACIRQKKKMNKEPMDEEIIRSETVSECWFGQHEVYWIFFYRYCNEILGVQYEPSDHEKLHLWNIMAHNANWWYPYERVCIISRKPLEVHIAPTREFEIDGKKAWDIYHLHCPNGPAVKFGDGHGLYSLNGVKVPGWLVDTDPDAIDCKKIFELSNAEVRREFVRKVTYDRIYRQLGGKVLHKQAFKVKNTNGKLVKAEYELISLNMGDDRVRPFLKMVNPSIETTHIEGVAPECTTVEQALNWRNNGLGAKPIILT